MIVFLFFLFITSIVLLIGAEVNAILQRKDDESVVRDRAEHPEKLESDEARDDATREADELRRRERKQVNNRAAAPGDGATNKRTPSHMDGYKRSTRKGSVGLIVAATVLGWLLGRRSEHHKHHSGGSRSEAPTPRRDRS